MTVCVIRPVVVVVSIFLASNRLALFFSDSMFDPVDPVPDPVDPVLEPIEPVGPIEPVFEPVSACRPSVPCTKRLP